MGCFLLRPLPGAGRLHLSGVSHAFSLCAGGHGVSSSGCKDTSHNGSGSQPHDLIKFNYFPKGPLSKYSHIGG